MGRSIDPSKLGEEITKELTLYRRSVLDKVNAAGEKAIKALVKKTKATAPKDTGDYAKSITYKTDENPATGDKRFIWGAKSPHHRLTHLLVHGHPTPTGGRVPGDPFLEDALEAVLPEYERDVEEALK